MKWREADERMITASAEIQYREQRNQCLDMLERWVLLESSFVGHPNTVLKDTNAMLDQFRATPSGVPEELMGHHEDIKFLVFKLNEVIAYLRRNHEDHT